MNTIRITSCFLKKVRGQAQKKSSQDNDIYIYIYIKCKHLVSCGKNQMFVEKLISIFIKKLNMLSSLFKYCSMVEIYSMQAGIHTHFSNKEI